MPVLTVSIRYLKLVDTVEQMCDKYCRFPKEPGAQEDLEAICEKCPLNNIMHDDALADE